MPNYHAISIERHANKRWDRLSNYAFAAAEPVIALTAAELSKAIMSMPVAFIAQGETYVPAAVLGVQSGNNLFVAPDGRWVGRYIPAAFRAYPFLLAATPEGQHVLCIDEGSDRFTLGPAGEHFFNDDGQPTQAVLDILNSLTQIEQSRVVTAAACAVLQKHELIRPWPITLKTDSGEQQIAGLFQVDEVALNKLSAETLLEVSQAGGLPIAYCQLLSMQHLPMLGQLIKIHTKAVVQATSLQQLAPNGDLDLDFLTKNGTISFAGLF